MIPETFEDIAATALARWLSARDEEGRLPPPPADLDPEVVEAVYALRPDFAPSPTMVLEDVWQTLDEAPRLQEWLDGGSSEGIDEHVREAVYALNPHRAPAATVTVDEILATLKGAPKLARFLEDGATDIDDDVREAVFALRPDLAPPPKVTIDDILKTVDGAPKLARFLDDSDQSDTLDPDVMEAVYAMRPELAPGPKVQMDDIFARIQSGPFAKKAEPVAFSEAPGQEHEVANTPMVPRDKAGEPEVANKPIRRRRGWIAAFLLAGGGGAAALMAAAAAVLLVVGIGVSTNGGSPQFAPAEPTTEMASAPRAPDPVPAAPGNFDDNDKGTADARRIPEADRGLEPKQAEMRPVETVATKDSLAGPKGEGVNYGVGADAPAPEDGFGGAMTGPAPKPPPPAVAVPVDEAPAVARTEAKEDAKPAAAKVSAEPAKAKTAAYTKNVKAPELSTEDAETQATARQADSSAAASIRFRDYRAAAEAYATIFSPPHASIGVVQWYAAKAGEQYLLASDPAAAVAITDRAIAKGKSPQRAAALRVKGDALSALGRDADAVQAYDAATK